MEGIRKIYLNVYGDGTIIPSDDTIGYVGDHLAALLVFKLSQELLSEDYIYSLNFEDESGNVTVGALEYPSLTFAVPQALTATNSLKLELLISNREKVIFNSSVVTLKIHSSLTMPEEAENKYVGLLEETLSAFRQLTEQINVEELSKLTGITAIEKTDTQGLNDIYTITYSDGSTGSFTVANGSRYALTDAEKSEIAQLAAESFSEKSRYNMEYISGSVTVSPGYAYSNSNAAANAPVKIHIVYGGGNSQLIRLDGEPLIDTLSGKVIDRTMTDVEITAADLAAGITSTEGANLTISYYNKSCEDLLNRLGGLSSVTIANQAYSLNKNQDEIRIETNQYESEEL